MINLRILVAAGMLCCLAVAPCRAQTGAPSASKSQSDLASRTIKFGTVSKSDDSCAQALDAHNLSGGLKLVNTEGAFTGTVARVFQPRSGTLAILNFDDNYRTAMTAIVRSNHFARFPDLKLLVGKAVLVSGKFSNYHDAAEIVLTNVVQIKVVE
jgi:hypothetical protein